MISRFSLLFLISTLCSFLTAVGQEGHPMTIAIEEGINFQVYTLYDKAGLIEEYQSHLNVPVCEDRVCYNVKATFYWNAIGEFEYYKISPKDTLTKLDHEPFTPEDHQKLQNILSSQDLNFVNIPREELVDKSDSSEVDGYTGATKATVKKEVIEGALYTCYTLWHIANGAVIDSIKSNTLKYLDGPLIQKLIQQDNQTVHYFLINNLNTKQFKENMDSILGLMTSSKGYFSKNAIEKIPQELFALNSVQEFILANYIDLDYYTQTAILKKLDKTRQSSDLKNFILNQINEKNTFQNQKLIALVLHDINQQNLQQLLDRLKENKISVSEENYQAIKSLSNNFALNSNGLDII